MDDEITRIFVTGHRNPDVDSLASSYALAELRKRQGCRNVLPICPGVLPERAKYLFDRFHLTPPAPKSDLYLRVADLMEHDSPVIAAGTTLMEAVRTLNGNQDYSRLPVVGADGRFAGMLSPITLLSQLLDVGAEHSDTSLAGRQIRSSIRLIAQVIEAETLTEFEPEVIQEFKVYVAAMGVESLDSHLPAGENHELALICGDRPEIHLCALQRKLRLLIVTGDKSVEPLILKEAAVQHVTILKTKFDSATVIRRLKFSIPVELLGFAEDRFILNGGDRIQSVKAQIMAHPEDVIPVAEQGIFKGVVCKRAISRQPPYRLILVDHNEPEQSIPGIEEIPVIEVVDHHRIGMMQTRMPIKFTGDVVGSTCTLVAGMFKSSGESLTPELAGLLLGGIVTDTMNLKSPTTSKSDHRLCEWLEKISGVKAAELMAELSSIDSPFASHTPREVIDSDRKSYTDGRFHFSLSQVEESNLELPHTRKTELLEAMQAIMTEEKLHFIGLLVTDAVRENSEFLVTGDSAVIRNLPYGRTEDGFFQLPGVLSRKKQLLPQILAITTALTKA